MTKYDKTNLLYFITRTGMYISPVDENNVVSFIHGYELGTESKCDFTQLIKQLLSDKYKINYMSTGWPGQITRLSKKLTLSWEMTFKKIALEIVAGEQGLEKSMQEILKSRIVSLLERINPIGDIYFNDYWTEEWLILCPVKSNWFKQLWTDKEWITIKSINNLIQADNIFQNKDKKIPTPELQKLKEQYDEHKSTNR
jgi:hypothetical protein